MSDGSRHRVGDIAVALGATVWGDPDIWITGAAEPAHAQADQIAIAMGPAYAAQIGTGAAQVALLWADAEPADYGLAAAVLAERPRHALAGLTALLDPGPALAVGVHPSAVIDPTAEIAEDVAIGPFVVVGPRARIGAGSKLSAYACVGAEAFVGPSALLHERVVLGARVRVGARFIAQPGAVLGGDGFSFVTPERSAVEEVRATLGDTGDARQQGQARIHSLGAVRVGDDVEVGALSCIDRGTVADTEIGDGTKIDSHVMIGHNVRIGRDALICGQAGIAGSAQLGDRVVLGARAGVLDHLTLGDDVICAAGTMVRTDQPAGRVVMGDPAVAMKQSLAMYKALRRLPRLMERLRKEGSAR